MRVKFGSAAALFAIALAFTPAGWAADAPEAELKAEIDGLLGKLDASTQGALKWDGADKMDFRRDGNAAVADIANARLTINAGQDNSARVEFNHIEIRRAAAPDNAVAYAVVFPGESKIRGADGQEVTLTLKDAGAHATIDPQSGRTRDAKVSFAGARLENKASGDWMSFGPLSVSSGLVAAADGGWAAPADFELKQIEFFFTGGPVGGIIDRIGYSARAAGPDLAALNRFRDRLDAIQKQADSPPEERLNALFGLLPGIPALFSLANGELSVQGVTVRAPTGEPFVAFEKATISGAVTGLSGDAASLRVAMRHEGLVVSSTLLDPAKVPRRTILDFGLENIATAPLRNLIEAARTMREGVGEEEKQRGTQQMIGAAAMLNPVFKIYNLLLDTPDVGVTATAEASGSPLAPKGYHAAGEIAVRGFDALPDLIGDAPLAHYLPVLKELGVSGNDQGGAPALTFRVASEPPTLITVNGNDESAWLSEAESAPGQPRLLRPAEPPLSGPDVRAVQRALVTAKVETPQSGEYDGDTAAAVARFQKQSGLNVSGVVDAATRQKLGVKGEPAGSAGPKPAPGRPGGERPPTPRAH